MFREMFSIPTDVEQQIRTLQTDGKTVMLLGTEHEIMGIIAVADQVRRSSLSVIQRLKNLGMEKIVMLTGDNQTTATAIGNKIGLTDAKAKIMTEDKPSTKAG